MLGSLIIGGAMTLPLFGLGLTLLLVLAELIASGWIGLVGHTPSGFGLHFVNTTGLVASLLAMVVPMLAWIWICFKKVPAVIANVTLFVTLMVLSLMCAVPLFHSSLIADSWRYQDFPLMAQDAELHVARRFNSEYCYAQKTYLCDRATLNTLLSLDFGHVVVSNITTPANDAPAQCLSRYGIDAANTPKSWMQICAYCVDSSDWQNLILNWTISHCAFSTNSINWCEETKNAQLALGGGDLTLEFQGSPYVACRDTYLAFTHKWSVNSGGVSIGLALSSAAMLWICYLICKGIRSEERPFMPPTQAASLATVPGYVEVTTPTTGTKTNDCLSCESDTDTNRTSLSVMSHDEELGTKTRL